MVRATYFSVIVGHLYRMGNDEILRCYVPKFERSHILVDMHEGIMGGHYAGRVTIQNVPHVGLWWPPLHQDLKAHCRACDIC